MLSQFTKFGVNWDNEKFPIILSSFLRLSQLAWIWGVLGHFRAFKKQHIMLKLTVFNNIQVYCHWCLFFFLFDLYEVSPQHKANFVPLYTEKVLFHIWAPFCKRQHRIQAPFQRHSRFDSGFCLRHIFWKSIISLFFWKKILFYKI